MKNKVSEQQVKKELLEISLGKKVTKSEVYNIILFSKESIENINIFIPESFKIKENSLTSFFKYAYSIRDKQKKEGKDSVVSIIENRILQCFHEATTLQKYKLFDYNLFFSENQVLFEETLSLFCKDTDTSGLQSQYFMDKDLIFRIPNYLISDIENSGKIFIIRHIKDKKYLVKCVENKNKMVSFAFSYNSCSFLARQVGYLNDIFIYKGSKQGIKAFISGNQEDSHKWEYLFDEREMFYVYILENMDVFYPMIAKNFKRVSRFHKYLFFEDTYFFKIRPSLFIDFITMFINDPNIDNSKYIYEMHPELIKNIPDDLLLALEKSGKQITIKDSLSMECLKYLVENVEKLESFSFSMSCCERIKQLIPSLFLLENLKKSSESYELFICGKYKNKKGFLDYFHTEDLLIIYFLENLPVLYRYIVKNKDAVFIKQFDEFLYNMSPKIGYFLGDLKLESDSNCFSHNLV